MSVYAVCVCQWVVNINYKIISIIFIFITMPFSPTVLLVRKFRISGIISIFGYVSRVCTITAMRKLQWHTFNNILA